MTHYAIVGAGQVGRRLAALLTASGNPVDLISRSGTTLPDTRGIAADAADRQALLAATADAEVIYNCANPAYHRWTTDWPPIANNLLMAAHNKTLVTLSNLYGYGPVVGPMTESTPMNATTVKGSVRARMWADALDAHEAGQLRAVEVRASDYIGESGDQVMFGSRVIPRMVAGKSVQLLGRADQPHTWTYTGDVAALLAVVGTDERAFGRAWHVPSAAARTQAEVIADLASELGVVAPRIRTAGALQLRLGGLFSPSLKELAEMLYEFDRPFITDSTAAQATFGLSPTSWEDIITDTVRSNSQPQVV